MFTPEAKKLLLRCWTVTQVSMASMTLNHKPLSPLPPPPPTPPFSITPRLQLLALHPQGRAALIQCRCLPAIVSFIDGDDAIALQEAEAAAAAQTSSSTADASKDEQLASAQVSDLCVKLGVAFIQVQP